MSESNFSIHLNLKQNWASTNIKVLMNKFTLIIG